MSGADGTGRADAGAATIDHPLLDGAGPGWVATEIRSDVVALTTGMSDFLRAAAIDGRRAIVITGEQTRMTPPLTETLGAVGGHWVVRVVSHSEGTAPFYDARSGRPLAHPADVLSRVALTEVHPSFTRSPLVTRAQLVASVSTRHRVSRPLRLGGAAEVAARVLTGAQPQVWGALEPFVAGWDRDDLTARTRRRMPQDSRWAASAGGPHPFVATLQAARTREGIEETTRVWADLGGPGDARVAAAPTLAADLLTAAAGVGMPLLGVALLTVGAPDLARRPLLTAPPEPLALLIGPPGVRALGVDAASWAAETGGVTVGSPRLPGVLVPLGTPDGGGWQRMTAALERVDPGRLRDLLGPAGPAVPRPAEERPDRGEDA